MMRAAEAVHHGSRSQANWKLLARRQALAGNAIAQAEAQATGRGQTEPPPTSPSRLPNNC
jgi:hypothetical protein